MYISFLRFFLCTFLLGFVVAYCSPISAANLNCATAQNIHVDPIVCQSLIDLYDNTHGTGWSISSGWDTDTNICTWYGISCLSGGNQNTIGTINLAGNNLHGILPNSLGSLTSLQNFVVDNNNLHGSLPATLAQRIDIRRIDISVNNFSGSLDPAFSSRQHIQNFSAGFNGFSGYLPGSWSSRANIQYFNMVANNIGGQLPGSRSAWAPTIRRFDISHNNIIGNLPSSRGSWSIVEEVDVRNNNLFGNLPASRSGMFHVQEMYLAHNNLTGPLPSVRSSLQQMITFDARNNQLSGPLPSSWSSLSNMERFWISFNAFGGVLPSTRSQWTSLQVFFADHNQFVGSVPGTWRNGWPNRLSPYVILHHNCLQMNASPLMQTWIGDNVLFSPQNTCNFTVSYSAVSGGYVSGLLMQNIPYGAVGLPVYAVGSPGCIFDRWSDGSTANPRMDTNVIGNFSVYAQFLCNTLPLNNLGQIVPAISFWQGKVNQYFDTNAMQWKSDPTGLRGGGSSQQWGSQGWSDRPLDYCRIFYPATISVQGIGVVTIHTWMREGNTMPRYTGTKKAYHCVQSLSQQSNLPSSNRYVDPSPNTPIKNNDLPSIDTLYVPTISPSLPVTKDKSISVQSQSLVKDAESSYFPTKEVVYETLPVIQKEQKDLPGDTMIDSRNLEPIKEEVIFTVEKDTIEKTLSTSDAISLYNSDEIDASPLLGDKKD